MMRFRLRGTSRLLGAVCSLGLYALFFGLVPVERPGELAPLCLVPAIIAAALGGYGSGLVAVAGITALNTWLFPESFFTTAGIVGHGALVPTIAVVAWLRSLRQRADAQTVRLALLAAEQEALRQREEHRARQANALARLTPELLAAETEQELLAVLARDLRRLVPCERSVTVDLLQRTGGPALLAPAYADGALAAAALERPPWPPAGAAGHALRTGTPSVWTGDDPEPEALAAPADRPGAMMALPLLGRDGPIGTVSLTSQRPARYTDDEAELALLFCNQAALALENLRLSAMAAEAQALRRLAGLKDELMRTVSHELRTPLSYIYGYSELLVEAADLSPRDRTMAERIHEAAEHMRRLVDDLLELGRLEAGQFTLEPEPGEVEPWIERAVEQVRLAGGAGHALVVEVQPALPAVFADAYRTRQVLSNLLTNAVRYSPAGTEIRVGARAVPPAGGSARHGQVEVWVADQGVGLTPEQTERIFEKFYRGAVEVTGKHPGAGLGLAISRGLVEAQGGRIWAESAGPGTGATLRFTLPVAHPEAPPEGDQRADDPAAYSLRTKESAASSAAVALLNEPRLR